LKIVKGRYWAAKAAKSAKKIKFKQIQTAKLSSPAAWLKLPRPEAIRVCVCFNFYFVSLGALCGLCGKLVFYTTSEAERL
jgi:hypothetical protein